MKLYYVQCKQFQYVDSMLYLVRLDKQFFSCAVEIFFGAKTVYPAPLPRQKNWPICLSAYGHE